MAPFAPSVNRQDRAWHESWLSVGRTCNHTIGETTTVVESRFYFPDQNKQEIP